MKHETRNGPKFSRSSLLAASWLRCAALIALLFSVATAHAADINISAAISLKAALDQAQPELERAAGGKINLNYGASGTLAAQIRQGKPVDLFLSADRDTMDRLLQAKLIDETTVAVLAGNQLVLVTPAAPRAGVNIKGFADLTGDSVQHIAIGEPKVVPAGVYAMQTLQFFKLYDTLNQGHKLITCENVAQVLAYVARGEVDAGLVYRTDAKASKDVQVVATAPAQSHDPVVYVMGIPKGAPNVVEAQRVETAILGEKVQKIFANLGFAPPEPATTNPKK